MGGTSSSTATSPALTSRARRWPSSAWATRAATATTSATPWDELKTCFQGSGAEIVGSWSTDGYDHMESKSVDGAKFVGLACDEDNQPEMSEDRVKAWIAQIKGEGMPL